MAKFIKIEALKRYDRMPKYQELMADDFVFPTEPLKKTTAALPFLGRLTFKSNFKQPLVGHFISHRWESKLHPDPDGYQLKQLVKEYPCNAIIWYDYCCLPQEPRNADEQTIFEAELQEIPEIIKNSWFYIIGRDRKSYDFRAWCQFELICAINSGTFADTPAGREPLNNFTELSKKSAINKKFVECLNDLPKRKPPRTEEEIHASGATGWEYVGGYYIDTPDLNDAAFAKLKDFFFKLEVTDKNDLEVLWNLLRKLFPARILDCTYVKY